MKTVRYTVDAAKSLKRHGNAATRIRNTLNQYASGSGAHVNNVTQLVGSTSWRLRIGDYRAIFEQTETEIIVTKVAPRGEVYD